MENTAIPKSETSTVAEPVPIQRLFWPRGIAIALGLIALYIGLAMVSCFFTGLADQSLIDALRNPAYGSPLPRAANWTGLLGAWIAHFMVFEWLGGTAMLIPIGMSIAAYNLYYPKKAYDLYPLLLPGLFSVLWLSTLLGFLALKDIGTPLMYTLSGGMGYELAHMLHQHLNWGTAFLLLGLLVLGVLYGLKKPIQSLFQRPKGHTPLRSLTKTEAAADPITKEILSPSSEHPKPPSHPSGPGPIASHSATAPSSPAPAPTVPPFELEVPHAPKIEPHLASSPDVPQAPKIDFEIRTQSPEMDTVTSEAAPKSSVPISQASAPSYRLPPLSLLAEKSTEKVQIDEKELTQNKEKIVETLTNFRIEIAHIKATIGPTVTLYEIVPAPGVRISKIKNLEDDIALSLAALGIRIIAPIPGKGTIGIEVPNKQRELTPLRAAFAHAAFQSCTHALPIVLGKDITGEVQVVDLARMPHLLMAGATGQGKSVGLNVMLSSLLYKRQPSELKLVLIDPKKVELSLFACIEQHFLAKLPDNKEAIITDTQQVVHTLSSLCQEMDTRYELLQSASCRNIKEYNNKYKKGALGHKEPHHFLPYIVLVIDELADLMMTAGKEVETPIARLAQLARAIGIHLIVATQRPSVNVITGLIKANFPARISYRVSSQVDSRTILDTRGAEQLVGAGDMLFSTGNEHIRLQCPYVDTTEVEAICKFIQAQAGCEAPYALPEVSTEDPEKQTLEIAERDTLFEEAAALVVRYRQGSASLIQRKMKIGFARAGRLIDQMEAANIVGPPTGSKPREVLILDEIELQHILKKLKDNENNS